MASKKTKIVCTIGPSSEDPKMLEKLARAGMNVCRLNFSHGTHEEHKKRIENIQALRKKTGLPLAILLDTKGPEIRTGTFGVPEVNLQEGDRIVITMKEVIGDEKRFTVTYKDLAKDITAGDSILIDDGLVELKAERVEGDEIYCVAMNYGTLKDRKGVNVPNVKINLPAITEQDIEDLKFGASQDVDFIAASFIRKAQDVLEIREILEAQGGEHIHIIAKIENQQGVDNIDEILEVSDGLMVARGDLGVEVPTPDIPLIQKKLIQKANLLSKPVITATQMLDSMIRNPRPTRAEVTDVANAIFDGTDAIMLSGETAAGKYPQEAVLVMDSIARRTEQALDYDAILRSRQDLRETNITNAISHATCSTARDLKASAIITATSSGHTARMVSAYRPKAPIIAAVTEERVRRKMALVWGVTPLRIDAVRTTDDIFDISVQRSLEAGLIRPGELIVITAGVPVGKSGTTNLIKVHLATEVIVRGIGIGTTNVSGVARIIRHIGEDIHEGEILLCESTDIDMVPLMMKAGAILTEQGGITSHAAVVGVSLGKPVIVSAQGLLEKARDGEKITVDSLTGIVYRGQIDTL